MWRLDGRKTVLHVHAKRLLEAEKVRDFLWSNKTLTGPRRRREGSRSEFAGLSDSRS